MQALTANEMDVDEAYWAIQCEGLHELYEYIFSEWSKVKQTDMEDIKKLLKKGEFEKEVAYCIYINPSFCNLRVLFSVH